MSEPSFADILVSEFVSKAGSPRDYAAELLGAGMVTLAILAYVAFEFGVAAAITRAWRALRPGTAVQTDQERHEPVEKPE